MPYTLLGSMAVVWGVIILGLLGPKAAIELGQNARNL